MNDICNDNREILITKYYEKLIEETNIETSYDEMQVLKNILFRMWQLGWLDVLERSAQKHKQIANDKNS